MNPELLIQLASLAIKDRPFSIHPKYHLCFFNQQIRCLPKNHTEKRHQVFMVLSGYTCERGLTCSEWDKLSVKLHNFFKDKQ